MYTTSTALLEALTDAGVSYIFANWGSDHPGLIEALAEADARGLPRPRVVTCPNEMVGLSAAHGFALVSGRAQAVIVHVDCGTLTLAGAIHNADKGRVPVFIFAGTSPFTQEGELKGSRNEFIHWIQDVHDQRGIVRGYMRYENEIRTGRNVKQLVQRAMQFAYSDPPGPVYLTAAREVLEEEIPRVELDLAKWGGIERSALPEEFVEELASALLEARRPLIVTSYLGRNIAAVGELVRICRRVGIGVLESVPSHMNFPHDNPLYQGNQWNHEQQNPLLSDADVILVIDSDVPWIPTRHKTANDATIYHIDVDPLKQQMPLWYLPARRRFHADAATAIGQLNRAIDRKNVDERAASLRHDHYSALHKQRTQKLEPAEEMPGEGITPEFVVASIRKQLRPGTIVMNEAITSYHTVFDHLAMSEPGSIYASGGGSLGWNGGAAIGAKLAAPDRDVIAITGDGSYMFSVPSTVHWMARQYDAPFLQVVLNNRGWKAPKLSTLAVHPNGFASRAGDLGTTFDPPADYAAIAAAAGGAFARTVTEASRLEEALQEALHAVRTEKRSAVLDVWLPRS